MYKYPILYFTLSKTDFIPEQVPYLIEYEREMGNVKLDTDIEGIQVDFNGGVRVNVPKGNFHVKISDAVSKVVAFDGDVSEQTLVSAEKYLIFWQVEIYKDDELVFAHEMDLFGQKVFIFLAGEALGDTIAILPYLRTIRDYYNCNVYFKVSETYRQICETYFSDIKLVDKIPDDSYAGYCLALFQKTPYIIADNSRLLTTDLAIRQAFKLPYNAQKQIYYPTEQRKISEKYVCIAVQASGIMKRWLYPNGWNTVVEYLKNKGYRVFCIDGESEYTEGEYHVTIPVGAEDFTGMLPLIERINLLSYADFFIGVSSGLTWLANACDIPVVLISGFTLPITEFDTEYRVMNTSVCHGCHSDMTVDWKEKCPYHKGTEREYECSKNIHPNMVVKTIDRLLKDIIT